MALLVYPILILEPTRLMGTPATIDRRGISTSLFIIMNHFTLNLPPDSEGFYGKFGGTFVPDILRPNITALKEAYLKYIDDPDFQEEFDKLMRDYVGRPTPLYYAKRLSEKYGTNVYLKREDLNHTGAHKINNAIGQVLLAKRMGKHRVIAETGAGQHGVATATVCALMGMECTVYMGKLDVDRQRPNVERMKMLGANVVPVTKGSATLADAVDVALMDWCENPDETFYLLGSAVGPDPYPQMVARFQSIISEEIKQQLLQLTGKPNPDYVIACIGGGSNASGAFYHFIPEENVQLISAEAGGLGANSGKTAASLTAGREGIIHGFKTMVLLDDDGNIEEPYSISAGLDYPGIGPMLAHLADTVRTKVIPVNDDQALKAAHEITALEGIIPALESSHAIAVLDILKFKPSDTVVINLSGRGDKDLSTYLGIPVNE